MLDFLHATLPHDRPAPAPHDDPAHHLIGELWHGHVPSCGLNHLAADQMFQVDTPCLDGRASHLCWRLATPVRRGSATCQEGNTLHWAESDEFLFATARANPAAPIAQQSQQVYMALLRTLQERHKPHPLRIWNYIHDINAQEHGEERYRTFNSGRRAAFEALGYTLGAGAPAACALGKNSGPLQVAILSSVRPPVAIENPRQISAYHYPAQYGIKPPLFSRAACYTQGNGAHLLLLSGTASIVGHLTMHPGDVAAQTQEAIHNVEALLAAAQAKLPDRHWRLQDIHGRVYVRHAADYPLVRPLLERRGMHHFSYAQADICRSDLLVEIEGEALAAPSPRHHA